MKNKILYLFLFVFFLSLFPNIYGEGKSKDDSLTVYFEPGKFEVSDNKMDTLIKKLDKSKKYKIEGCACKEDKISDEALMGIAARRSEKIAKILVDHGFSSKNITTVAYDLSSECKATIIEADDNKP